MTIKIKTINNQHAEAILGNRASYAHALSPVDMWNPGPMNATTSRQKNFLLLKFASNTDFRQKMVAW